MKKNKKMEAPAIAVVGSGYWGKNLIRNFNEIGFLKAICDKNEDTIEKFIDMYPDTKIYTSFHEVLRQKDIDAVAIATPAETHYTLAKEALLAGRHAFVEKPLVLSEKEAKELIEIAQEKGVVLMVGHLLQYHSAFLKLREMIKDGELGRIDYIYSNRLNLGKIRREENILWSFAPHDISMILSIAGELPKSVVAIGGYYLHKEIADVTVTHLNFASGLKAHIFVSWLHPFKEQKLIVVGEKGMVVFDDTKPWEEKLQMFSHTIKWENNIPLPDKAKGKNVHLEPSEPLKQECHHFAECIMEGNRPRTDGNEGLRVLSVLNMSQKSLNLNGKEIDLVSQAGLQDRTIDYFAHDTAVIDNDVKIGNGTKIWHFSHILKNTTLGRNCNIGQNVVAGPDVVVGDNCKIQNNVSVYKGVRLEDDVFCGPSMVFTNVYNPRANIQKMNQLRETLVRKGATIGANATIVCGVTIGEKAFIGAGALVNKDVPPHALMAGNPAKQIGWVCDCGETLPETLKCLACGNDYKLENGTITIK